MSGKKIRSKGGAVSYAKWGYIFILPFFLAFAIFQLIPLASTIYYSFFEYYRSGLKIIGPNFVGLENYKSLFQSDFLHVSFLLFFYFDIHPQKNLDKYQDMFLFYQFHQLNYVYM